MPMMIYLLCSVCGEHIEAPLSTLRQPYPYQGSSSNAFEPVAVACPQCKTVEVQSTASVLVAAVVQNPDPAEWHFDDVWLGCGVEGCESLLPFVYSWSGDTHEERVAETKTWRAKNLECPNGHPVSLPKFFD
jgi:hypothetical protein